MKGILRGAFLLSTLPDLRSTPPVVRSCLVRLWQPCTFASETNEQINIMKPSSATNKPILAMALTVLLATACKKDGENETPLPQPSGCAAPTACGTVTDIDGHSYSTVLIGNQCWTTSNLRTSRYRNGDAIPVGVADDAWLALTSGAYAIYDNASSNEATYGKLYNWYAATDPRGLCPSGWHVATDDEWKTLESSLGMSASEVDADGSAGYRGVSENVGGKLKGTSNWSGSSNTGATNCSGMGLIPAGCLGVINNGNNEDLAIYGNQGEMAWMWTSTEFNSDQSQLRALYRLSGGVLRAKQLKTLGLACRCVAD